MRPIAKLKTSLLTLFLTFLCIAGGASAQGFPDKPIRLVVPFPPAGVADILGRVVAERLGSRYGQPVVVVNRPGASGHIGAQTVATAAPDGYTLMVGTIGIHSAYSSYRKLNYDPGRDLQPVMILGQAPNIVLVPVGSPFKTFGQLLEHARANPGKLNYASAGPGSSVHMVTALFEMLGGVKLGHVPYKGSGPALVDLIGGQVDLMFDNITSSIAHVKGGTLRALAVTGGQREPLLPEVPTIAEAGVPGYAGTSWWTIAAPAGMPAELAAKLNRDIQDVLAAPEAQKQLTGLGVTLTRNSPEDAQSFFESETLKWNKVIAAADLKLD